MGYANPAQKSAGIHTRQYSRAFVIDDGIQRIAFVSVDCGMIDQIIKTEVILAKILYQSDRSLSGKNPYKLI